MTEVVERLGVNGVRMSENSLRKILENFQRDFAAQYGNGAGGGGGPIEIVGVKYGQDMLDVGGG